jgi:hypothetical protein
MVKKKKTKRRKRDIKKNNTTMKKCVRTDEVIRIRKLIKKAKSHSKK